MISSEEEIFNIPNRSLIKSCEMDTTSTVDQKSTLLQKLVKVNDSHISMIRNVSVVLTRLSPMVLKNKSKSVTYKSKRKRLRWKFGKPVITNKKYKESKPKSIDLIQENVQNQQTYRGSKRNTIFNLKNEPEGHMDVYKKLDDTKKKFYTNKKTKNIQRDVETVSSLVDKKQNEKDDSSNESEICARILPYTSKWQNYKVSIDYKAHTEIPLVLPSDNEDSLDSLNIDNFNIFQCTPTIPEGTIKQEGKNERVLERNFGSSDDEFPESFVTRRKRKCRRIIHNYIEYTDDDSDDDVVTVNNAITSNNQENSVMSYKMEQKPLQILNIDITRNLQVTLTRLEEMSTIGVTKWEGNKRKNVSQVNTHNQEINKDQIEPIYNNKVISEVSENHEVIKTLHIQSMHKEAKTLEQIEESKSTIQEKSIISEIPNVSNSSKLLIKSSSCDEESNTKNKIDVSSIKKITKKYKLFKKPKVLMIKLEVLGYSCKNNIYSATEIDCLTKKYIDSVMKFNFSCGSHKSLLYRMRQLQMRTNGDINDTTCEKTYETSCNTSMELTENVLLSTQSINEGNSMTTYETTDTSSNTNTPFLIRRRCVPDASSNPPNRSKFTSSKMLNNKKDCSSQRSLLEIWRKAFCAELSKDVPQETDPKPSTSVQANSKSLSFLQGCSTKATNETNENVPNSAASTLSSTKDNNTSNKSVDKFILPNEQTSMKTTCREISNLQSLINDINIPPNTDAKRSVSENNSKSIVSKNPCSESASEKNISAMDFFSKLNNMSTKTVSVLSEKTSIVKAATDYTTNDVLAKLKDSEIHIHNSSHTETQAKFKCLICNISFENYHLLKKHTKKGPCSTKTVNPISNNVKPKEPSEFEEMIMDKLFKGGLEKTKLSRSQQCSISKKSSVNKPDQFSINSEKEIASSSCSLIGNCSKNKSPLTQQQNFDSKNYLIEKSKSIDPSTSNKTSVFKKRLKKKRFEENKAKTNKVTCNICSQVFDTHLDLSKHIFKHTNDDLQKAYMLIKNKIASTNQTTNDSNDNNFDRTDTSDKPIDINTFKKKVIAAINESVSKQQQELRNSSMPLQKQKQSENKEQNLTKMRHTDQEQKKSSVPMASSMEHTNDKTLYTREEKTDNTEISSENSSASSELPVIKATTICECHRNEIVDELNVQMEIVLLCTVCQMLFRRFECFETHYRRAEGILCSKNRRQGRISKLFCSNCMLVLNSFPDMLRHLEMHAGRHRAGTATFRCNICKVIFYGIGPLFKLHFRNHIKNPFFLASRLSFPKISYVSSKLIKQSNDKPVEIYIQIADYVCKQCKMPFTTEKVMKLHEEVCQDNVEDMNTLNVNRTELPAEHRKVQILFVCGFCNKTFYTKDSFAMHSSKHKQKREMHVHYVCVTITAVKKIFICKVCTIVCQTLKEFEEHWQTHGVLREDYICTRCKNHYSTIDMFLEHAKMYKENDEKREPITCKVIYHDAQYTCNTCDLRFETEQNLQKHVLDSRDLPHTSLSYFEKKQFKQLSSGEQDSSELVTLDLSMRNKEVISMKPSVCSSSGAQAVSNNINTSLVSQISTTNDSTTAPSKQTTEVNNAINTDNSERLDDSEEELMIESAHIDETSKSNELNKQNDNVPFNSGDKKQNLTKSSNNEELCSTNAVPATVSAEVSNTVCNVTIPIESTATLCTNASVSKNDNQINNSTDTRNKEINANESGTVSTILPMLSVCPTPQQAVNEVPKPFLRVKSLSELMSTSKQHRCHICGLTFDCTQQLSCHMSTHNNTWTQIEQNDPIAPLNNQKTWQDKPVFNPAVNIPTTTLLPTIIENTTIRPIRSNNEYMNPINRLVEANNSRQYSIVGVKPLHAVPYNPLLNRVSSNNMPYALTWVPPQINVQQTPVYHQNLPAHIGYPISRLAQPSYPSTSAVTIRPFIQSTYPSQQVPEQPPPPPYSQQQINKMFP